MPDPVRLRKRSGGSSLSWEGKKYSWPEDGSVTEVPYDLATTLLGIQGADYSVEVEGEDAQPAEAAPEDEHKGDDKAGEAPESGDGSPITPKPRAGTRRTAPASRGTSAKK